MDGNLNYIEPDQGYDIIITNCGDGKAKVSWSGNEQELYIGDLKAQLRLAIEMLDESAETWRVPNKLDALGRLRAR